MGDVLWLGLPALLFVVAGGAVFWIRREKVRERFTRIARRRGGEVENSGVFPRAILPLEGGDAAELYCVMGGERARVARTYLRTVLAEDPGFQLDLTQRPARTGVLERAGREDPGTGNETFDRGFWMATDDADRARALLDDRLCEALLAVERELQVRVRIATDLPRKNGLTIAGLPQPIVEVAVRRVPPDEGDVDTLVALLELARSNEGLPLRG